ncbi:hypothetical protein [Streptomyces sp. NPDC059460]|uniref:hypothetical protein n=1 Tax=Streptomyces sp. NPDC059460 TaxID=3346840 RepID=UPI003691FAB7
MSPEMESAGTRAARDISHNDLATAMHLKSRATAQTRRRTLLKTPPGELEQWATG